LVGHVHLHQHVAGEEFALGVDLAAAADLHDVLGRHQYLGEAVVQILRVGLLADRLGHLLLEVRVGVDDVPLVAGGGGRLAHDPRLPSLSIWFMTNEKPASTLKKKIADITTMMPTITEVIQVSFQLVQVTLRASARTSL